MKNKTTPIRTKEEVTQNPDPKIDQDFKGFPHGTAKKETIKPHTSHQEKTADLDHTDGEKKNYKQKEIDEQDSDGSAGAFDDK